MSPSQILVVKFLPNVTMSMSCLPTQVTPWRQSLQKVWCVEIQEHQHHPALHGILCQQSVSISIFCVEPTHIWKKNQVSNGIKSPASADVVMFPFEPANTIFSCFVRFPSVPSIGSIKHHHHCVVFICFQFVSVLSSIFFYPLLFNNHENCSVRILYENGLNCETK